MKRRELASDWEHQRIYDNGHERIMMDMSWPVASHHEDHSGWEQNMRSAIRTPGNRTCPYLSTIPPGEPIDSSRRPSLLFIFVDPAAGHERAW